MAQVLACLPTAATEVVVPYEPPGEAGRFARLALAPFAELLDKMTYGIPNRASGFFTSSTTGGVEGDQEVRRVFGALQAEVLEADWTALKQQHLAYRDSLRQRDDSRFWRSFDREAARWRDQPAAMDCPVSLVWAAMPAPFPRERLTENLAAVDDLYRSIKRWRPVRPWTAGAPVGKCTEWHRQLETQPSVARGYCLDPGERLCHVCWTRRMAGYAGRRRFPSTGEVAAAAWRAAVADPELLGPLLEDLERSELGTRDAGAVLLASPRELRERFPEEAETILSRRGALRDEIVRLASRGEPAIAPAPPRYLALLAFDGDDMGRRVQQQPRGMPRAMHEFAVRAAAHLEAQAAAVFYLAGDEGLALVPASAALATARGLRRTFAKEVATVDATATLSVGVALFEHGRPLAGAARAVRAVLARCKALPGKDALGMTVATASGSAWSFVERWGPAWERVQHAVELIAQERLAAGWAYDVERFLAALPAEAWGRPAFLPAVEAEVRRLFFRRLAAEGRTAEERHAWRSRRWDEQTLPTTRRSRFISRCCCAPPTEGQPWRNSTTSVLLQRRPSPRGGARKLAAGEALEFDLLLIGRAADLQAFAVLAVERMAAAGLGRARHPFALARVACREPDGRPRELLAGGSLAPAPLELPARELPDPAHVLLRFLTPTRLKIHDHLVATIGFRALAFAMLRRTLELAHFHVPGAAIDWTFRPLLQAAAGVRIKAERLSWRDWQRRSNRQQCTMTLGGFVGEIELVGDLMPFAPLLRAAEILHVGKGATFGLGKVEIA